MKHPRMSVKIIFFTALLLGRGVANLSAKAPVGAEFLRVNPDPRSAALGNGGVTDAESGFSLYQNPALAPFSEARYTLAGSKMQWLEEVEAGHYAVSFRGGVPWEKSWALGIFIGHWRSGAFAAADAGGNFTGNVNYAAQNAGVSMSGKIFHNIYGGVSHKKISQTFTEPEGRTTASAAAWDFGLYMPALFPGISAGASAQNLGGKMKWTDKKESLPAVARAGLSGRLLDGRARWTVEGAQIAGKNFQIRSGVSLTPFSLITLRGGYDTLLSQTSPLGITSGLGFRFQNVQLDYAFTPFGDLGVTQQISLTWKIGTLHKTVYK